MFEADLARQTEPNGTQGPPGVPADPTGPAPAPEAPAAAEESDFDWVQWLQQANLGNIIVAPPKLHLRKHDSESVFEYRPYLEHIWIPLFLYVLPYAEKKWQALKGHLQKLRKKFEEDAAAAAASERKGDDEHVEDDVDEGVEETKDVDDPLNFVDALSEVSDVLLESMFPIDAPPASQEDDGDDDGNEVLLPGGGMEQLDEGSIADMARTAVANLDDEVDAAEAEGLPILTSRKAINELSVQDLDMTLEAYKLDTSGSKAERQKRLWDKVKPKPNHSPTGNERTAKVNLHRLKQTFFHVFLMWDGETQGWKAGRNVRGKVIDYAKRALAAANLAEEDETGSRAGTDDDEDDTSTADDETGPRVTGADDEAAITKAMAEISDDVAIEWAIQKSSFFFGFWRCFDVELRYAVVPFEKHAEGDITHLLNGFEVITLQICAADKPMIRKVVLILFHFLLHYRDNHSDIIKFMCHNAAMLDEEYIEFLNALLGRFVKARQVLDIQAYRKTSGLITALHALERRLDETALPSRTTEATEHHRLRTIYATKTWEETNDKVEQFILGLATKAIDGDKDLDGRWPVHDRLQEAWNKMPRFITELEAWLKTQRRVDEVDEPPPPPVDTRPTITEQQLRNDTERNHLFSREQHLLFEGHLANLQPDPEAKPTRATILKNYVKKPAKGFPPKYNFKFRGVNGNSRAEVIADRIARKVKEQWEAFLPRPQDEV